MKLEQVQMIQKLLTSVPEPSVNITQQNMDTLETFLRAVFTVTKCNTIFTTRLNELDEQTRDMHVIDKYKKIHTFLKQISSLCDDYANIHPDEEKKEEDL